MKNAVICITVVFFIVFTFIIVISIQTQANIREEIYTALDSSINTTERVLYDKRVNISSNDMYLEEFNKNLKSMLKEREDVMYYIDVYGIDYEKGLLDIQVRGVYKNLLGNDIEVRLRKTMIIDAVKVSDVTA